MGGSDSTTSHHYHTIEYRTDPETVKMLEHNREQITLLTKMIADLQKSYEAALLKAK